MTVSPKLLDACDTILAKSNEIENCLTSLNDNTTQDQADANLIECLQSFKIIMNKFKLAAKCDEFKHYTLILIIPDIKRNLYLLARAFTQCIYYFGTNQVRSSISGHFDILNKSLASIRDSLKDLTLKYKNFDVSSFGYPVIAEEFSKSYDIFNYIIEFSKPKFLKEFYHEENLISDNVASMINDCKNCYTIMLGTFVNVILDYSVILAVFDHKLCFLFQRIDLSLCFKIDLPYFETNVDEEYFRTFSFVDHNNTFKFEDLRGIFSKALSKELGMEVKSTQFHFLLNDDHFKIREQARLISELIYLKERTFKTSLVEEMTTTSNLNDFYLKYLFLPNGAQLYKLKNLKEIVLNNEIEVIEQVLDYFKSQEEKKCVSFDEDENEDEDEDEENKVLDVVSEEQESIVQVFNQDLTKSNKIKRNIVDQILLTLFIVVISLVVIAAIVFFEKFDLNKFSLNLI